MPSPDRFSPATRAWFDASFAAPTPAQVGAWAALADDEDVLVVAPTGSGKTLAAFLDALDRITTSPPPKDSRHRCRVLYVSPLKALAVDIERNLRSPLAGIRGQAARLGLPMPDVAVTVRSGDTPPQERRRFATRPPDILITTPESLFLVLTSRAREQLAGVGTVIVDEIHSLISTKRGSHLALSLERLDALLDRPARRIGLSATVRPPEEVATFLGGTRPVRVVAPTSAKAIEVKVVVPVEDMAEPGADADAAADPRTGSIWPAVEARVLDLVLDHRSTIVFANSRRLAERLAGRLDDLAAERELTGPVAAAHHGSVSREERSRIEESLKAGRLPAVVATSSLELGIDMGAVDLVVQVESPPSVAAGLQRIGRAGHQVGAVSRGVIFPKYRGDLLCAAVVAERMNAGAIEELRYPRNPLDVLAQQIVAMVAMEPWPVDDLLALARRAAPFRELPTSAFEAVLDMLAGRYPSDEFAELRPRLVWDRVGGVLSGRPGAQRLAVTSGGTIPDRGLFGVFLVGGADGTGSRRVGELDEEMVYESRVGEVFTLGASSWRIEDITHDRVLVSPAPGQPGKLPFWHGDTLGRPMELGRALGAFVRETSALPAAQARLRLAAAGLDGWAAENLLGYLAEQRSAAGHLPDDRTIVVERFRDELGDWRIAVHSPFGAKVHAPWALALAARLRESSGLDVQAMHTDDGIVLRLPDTDDAPPSGLAVFEAEEVEALVRAEVGGSALFASRFRECAARSLLLPRRRPDRRTPLWQQRQRAAQLLAVASRFGSFPVVLETMRECLQDVYDLPGLVGLMREIAGRKVRVVEVETEVPSPFARSLLFGYVAAFMYEGDAPLAERRAAALSLDSSLLAELLGQAELRELIDPAALESLEAELAWLTPQRLVRDSEGAADLLRVLGDLAAAEAALRGVQPDWLLTLEETRRAIRVRIAGEERWAPIEDAGRLRDALGTPLPVGVPAAFLEPVADPWAELVARYARTHGPFRAGDIAARYGVGTAVTGDALSRLAAAGRVVRGEFRPDGAGVEWCDAAVLRGLRRRSLARLRQEVEPVPATALARFLPAWQQLASAAGRGPETLLRVIENLQGYPLPASGLESAVLPARVSDYHPAMLDELCAAGEVVWIGRGALPGADGWITLLRSDTAALLAGAPGLDEGAPTPMHAAVLEALSGGAALFYRALAERVGGDEPALLGALWDLVWAGRVTNDTLAPLRALLAGAGGSAARARTRGGGRRRPALPLRSGPPAAAGRWSLVPAPAGDPTRRLHALAETLLDRYGVVTRGAVAAEHVPGGFAAIYRVLSGFEAAGRARRGYFVEGLGAAQFAAPGAVDQLRALAAGAGGEDPWQPPVPGGWAATGWAEQRRRRERSGALVLAATDPAQPYGAALPWPKGTGHRPGRKAGAIVVVVDGTLALYVERGGKTLLSFSDAAQVLTPAADALALAVREGVLGRLAVERADGSPVVDSPLAAALESAGFRPTPRGLRMRA
ncbi:MAG TPA: DEAD/DEAH box helicase [Mycobacteriales bacterium]|nr:DEAD/DEAH box helicase [Mycobacteriales bacterium]